MSLLALVPFGAPVSNDSPHASRPAAAANGGVGEVSAHRRHQAPLSLETLAYKYGTDKSKDDHKYVDIYHSLFHDRRNRVLNLTEIGVSTGQSVAMWTDYFEHANIWGFDPLLGDRRNRGVLSHFKGEPRVHLFASDAYNPNAPNAHGLVPGSMDIVIDDAWHYPNPAQRLIEIWWPLVKPGGYYVIEDMAWDSNAKQQLALLETPLLPGFRTILEENSAFFIDSLFGHRNFSDFQNATGDSSEEEFAKKRPAQCCTRSRRLHNSHMVVIQRRDDSRPLRPYGPNLADERRRPMQNKWMETTRAAAGGGHAHASSGGSASGGAERQEDSKFF